jgi:hypothetical protein
MGITIDFPDYPWYTCGEIFGEAAFRIAATGLFFHYCPLLCRADCGAAFYS